MNAPVIKGYCPGALNPMQSGDGMVVRIRPFYGKLSPAQADGIATMAAAHGNGMMDLTSRGNIQIRGVTDASYPGLIEGLSHMGLIDASVEVESRRNILVTPLLQTGDETETIVADLTDAISAEGAPQLPHKFGFAVDTGAQPVLQTASADIRLERDAGGGLILVPEGADVGKPVTSDAVITQAIDLARWFMEIRTDHTRMGKLLADGTALPPGYFVPRQAQSYMPQPGYTPLGSMVGLAFGQLPATTLASLAKQGGLRMTPWRMILVESARELPAVEGTITDPADPKLRITACTGAPDCTQGLAETRPLAALLAQHLKPDQHVHVSGCAKGCAHPKAAALTITATQDGFDLIKQGKAGDTPAQSALSPDDIIKAL